MSAWEAYTGNAEVDRLLFVWRRVIANAQGWERGFALGVQRDRRKPGWSPTPRQLAVMHRLAAETASSAPRDDDFDPIEREAVT